MRCHCRWRIRIVIHVHDALTRTEEPAMSKWTATETRQMPASGAVRPAIAERPAKRMTRPEGRWRG
jgi:hypothetical protein